MNYHGPRQLSGGPNAGKWHYTCHNKRLGTYAEGYCAEPDHTAHGTATEACECYKRYQLDHALRFEEDKQEPGVTLEACRECQVICTGYAEVGYGIPRHLPLCAAHRTREVVAKHYTVGESFGSC